MHELPFFNTLSRLGAAQLALVIDVSDMQARDHLAKLFIYRHGL